MEAVYFGGGTPSHINALLLGRVLAVLASRHGIADDAEISLEANPEDFGSVQAGELRGLGFNRVSFGAQSFDRRVLLSLGRRHQAGQIEKAVRAARAAGFDNLSMDLIYGTPGETDESWAGTLAGAVDLEPDHISCYALTVEPGTTLGRAVKDGAAAPDPDVQADRYEAADKALSSAGFERYEVSNWSRPGYECRYNLTVWAQGAYEAYGNGAHGFRNARRFHNIRRLEAYLDSVESEQLPRAGEDVIAGWDAEIDRLFVGLRRTVGVTDGPGVDALLGSSDGRRLLDAGLIAHPKGRLKVERPLLADDVHRSVLGLEPPEQWAEARMTNIVSGRADA